MKELSNQLVEELVQKALEARKNAYAPYSNFLVGAAVLTKEGHIYSGCNVENASYGLSNCGERTAIFKAVSEGSREIEAVAIVGNGDKYCSPCGACRQVIAEFGEHIQVIMANEEGQYIIKEIEELIPGAFTGRDLA